MRKLETMDWWPELVAKKDECSYRELGELFGATPGAIHRALKRAGHTKKRARSGPRTARAGKPEAPVIPGEYRLRAGTAEKLAPHLDKVGVLSDREVAELSGVSIQTIVRYRAANGIPSARSKQSRKGKKAPSRTPASKVTKRRTSKVEPFRHLLGTVSDSEVAKMAGVTTGAVTNYRHRLGIAARGGGKSAAKALAPQPKVAAPQPEAPAPQPKSPKAQASLPKKQMLAYRAQLAERTAIVVAPDLVAAARRAEAAGEVHSLELLGSVLS